MELQLKRMRRLITFSYLAWLLLACAPQQPTRIIVITSTPATGGAANPAVIAEQGVIPSLAPANLPATINAEIIPNPTFAPAISSEEHIVQSGDTLSTIAQRYNVDLATLLELNAIENPNLIAVGQVLALPAPPSEYTPNFKILADSRLVRSRSQFNIADFISQQGGYIRLASDAVITRLSNGASFEQTLSAVQVVERVSFEYSVDARVLLALLEYRAGWLSNPQLRADLLTHPLISMENSGVVDRAGLYKQLAWAANELNRGYYSWKYSDASTLQFADRSRVLYNPELNAGTVALHYFLSLNANSRSAWDYDLSPNGFYNTYTRFFGNPFENDFEIVPPNLQQPNFVLPFEESVIWRYTGGFHGGWGSGSAWAAVDFAPDEVSSTGVLCYVAQSWVTAVASGTIARLATGVIILDLDGDNDESTGWTVLYLHVDSTNVLQVGQRVEQGQRLGHPSCAGGFSAATHLHIGRRYNGEWLPADCLRCKIAVQPFTLASWRVIGIEGQEYQGYLESATERLQAEQGRETTINRISG